MMPEQPPNPPQQSANNVRKNSTQVGRDLIQGSGNSTTLNLVISVFVISVTALGGLAWAINVGVNPFGNSELIEGANSSETRSP